MSPQSHLSSSHARAKRRIVIIFDTDIRIDELQREQKHPSVTRGYSNCGFGSSLAECSGHLLFWITHGGQEPARAPNAGGEGNTKEWSGRRSTISIDEVGKSNPPAQHCHILIRGLWKDREVTKVGF